MQACCSSVVRPAGLPLAAARRANVCARTSRGRALRLLPRAQQEPAPSSQPEEPAAQPPKAESSSGSGVGTTAGGGGGGGGPGNEPDLQLPKEVINRIRQNVFGFDFFVTGVENYNADGVLFKGNLRGDPAVAYQKISARLKEEVGEAYKVYLLEDQESKPVAVVLPISAVLPEVSAVPEALLAALFGACTLLTTLNINGADMFNFVLLTFKFDVEAIQAAIPGTLALFAILGAHELGHLQAARQRGIQLAPPLFIPAGLGLLSSFGAITRVKSIVPDRDALASVAVAGPLYSSVVAAAAMLAGLVLTAQGTGGVEVAVDSFRESLLVGIVGQLAFGEQLFTADSISVNPLFVAGWAGLVINSINLIPAGELDGARCFLGLFGRRAASRMSTVTLLLLGLAGIINSLAVFWLLLVLTLQRGPIVPCENELSPLQKGPTRTAAIAMLLLPLLVLLPFPMLSGGPDLPNF